MPLPTDDTLLLAWTLARDLLARPGGRAGYLVTSAGERFLVIDLPLFGAVLQVSYAVPESFMQRWTLPPYLGARVPNPDNAHALSYYGQYIAAERATYAPRNPPSDPATLLAE